MGMTPWEDSPRITGTSAGNAGTGVNPFDNKWSYNGRGGYTPSTGPKWAMDAIHDKMMYPDKYKDMEEKRRAAIKLRLMSQYGSAFGI